MRCCRECPRTTDTSMGRTVWSCQGPTGLLERLLHTDRTRSPPSPSEKIKDADATSYEGMLAKAKEDLKVQAEKEKEEKKAKSILKQRAMKEVRANCPKVLAKHWADLLVSDLSDARKLVTRLKIDSMSSQLTSELIKLCDALEKSFDILNRPSQSAGSKLVVAKWGDDVGFGGPVRSLMPLQ